MARTMSRPSASPPLPALSTAKGQEGGGRAPFPFLSSSTLVPDILNRGSSQGRNPVSFLLSFVCHPRPDRGSRVFAFFALLPAVILDIVNRGSRVVSSSLFFVVVAAPSLVKARDMPHDAFFKQHKILPLQMEKIVLRQAEELKNQKTSLRAGKGKRQVVTCEGVSWPWPLVLATNECLFNGR